MGVPAPAECITGLKPIRKTNEEGNIAECLKKKEKRKLPEKNKRIVRTGVCMR